MKLINYASDKRYKFTEANKWAKDMLKGLKHDLKCFEDELKKPCSILNTRDYLEALFTSLYIKWFIQNYFEEE